MSSKPYSINIHFIHVAKIVAVAGICTIVVLASLSTGYAQTTRPVKPQLKLPALISDDMVLQRDKPVNVWGWAPPGEKVTIRLGDEKHTTNADASGNWKSHLSARHAGGPYIIRIKTAQDSIILKNILFGDVWLCSGQSNMEFQVKKVSNYAQELQQANYPTIRLLQVGKKGSQQPDVDISTGKWQQCNSKTVADFSAAGYFFGRELFKNTRIPIGLINSTWGGTAIEAWMSARMLQNYPSKQPKLKLIEADSQYILHNVMRLKKAEHNWFKKFYTETGQIDSAGNLIKHPDNANWIPVQLPGYINNQKIPVQFGISWYRKPFLMTADQVQRSWELNLGQVTEVSLIYINGHKLGESLSRYAENKLIVPPAYLNQGENELLIYAVNEAGPTGFPGDTKLALTNAKRQVVITLSGQWDFKQQTIHDVKGMFGPRPTSSMISTDYTFLYNGMIAPLAKMSIKGVIWYQGETNASKPDEYEFLLTDLIKGWRGLWNYKDMPFYIVQLANYNAFVEKQKAKAWARLQEVQKKVAFSTKNSGLAVTYDIGNPDNIHPKNKQDVGLRLSLIAMKNIYHQDDVVCYGPMFKKAVQHQDSLILSFEPSSSGLINRSGSQSLNNFMIAGANKVFYPATAVIRARQVIAFSNRVSQPVYIRYAFDCNPIDVNFYNKAGLPAIPFRTDDAADWLK